MGSIPSPNDPSNGMLYNGSESSLADDPLAALMAPPSRSFGSPIGGGGGPPIMGMSAPFPSAGSMADPLAALMAPPSRGPGAYSAFAPQSRPAPMPVYTNFALFAQPQVAAANNTKTTPDINIANNNNDNNNNDNDNNNNYSDNNSSAVSPRANPPVFFTPPPAQSPDRHPSPIPTAHSPAPDQASATPPGSSSDYFYGSRGFDSPQRQEPAVDSTAETAPVTHGQLSYTEPASEFGEHGIAYTLDQATLPEAVGQVDSVAASLSRHSSMSTMTDMGRVDAIGLPTVSRPTAGRSPVDSHYNYMHNNTGGGGGGGGGGDSNNRPPPFAYQQGGVSASIPEDGGGLQDIPL